MTPEDFLMQHDALAGVVEALSPIYQLVARVRQGFIEEAGVGEVGADLLTVEWCKTFMFPMLDSQVAA